MLRRGKDILAKSSKKKKASKVKHNPEFTKTEASRLTYKDQIIMNKSALLSCGLEDLL